MKTLLIILLSLPVYPQAWMPQHCSMDYICDYCGDSYKEKVECPSGMVTMPLVGGDWGSDPWTLKDQTFMAISEGHICGDCQARIAKELEKIIIAYLQAEQGKLEKVRKQKEAKRKIQLKDDIRREIADLKARLKELEESK